MTELTMVPNKQPGCLVYIEGGEFAGKTTLLPALRNMIEDDGLIPCSTKEPTSANLFGRTVRAIYQLNEPEKLIRECIDIDVSIQDNEYLKHFVALGKKILKRKLTRPDLLGNPDLHMFLQLGMIFDRSLHHTETLLPALMRGEVVLSDRCSWSTIAYARANGVDSDYLIRAHNFILGDRFVEPDILLFLDVSLEVAMSRKSVRGSDELFEREPQMRKNLQVYRDMYFENIFRTAVRIDADQSPEDVLESSWQALQPVLFGKRHPRNPQ